MKLEQKHVFLCNKRSKNKINPANNTITNFNAEF